MPDQSASNCPICGQAKTPPTTGSFTQWISVCKCDESASSAGMEALICAKCFKQIQSNNTGSFTGWVFEQNGCTCEQPVPLKRGGVSTDEQVWQADEQVSQTERQPGDDGSKESVESQGAVNKADVTDLTEMSFPKKRYKPIEKLGEGGSGSVYLCQDKHLRKNVAVKIIKASQGDQLSAFQSEAKVTARLRHPNVVSVLDFGITVGSAPYMVLEYVNGTPLSEMIAKRGHLPPLVALPIFIQIASGLATAHEMGILHRDVKSSNILITGRGHKDQNLIHDLAGQARVGASSEIGGTARIGGTGDRADQLIRSAEGDLEDIDLYAHIIDFGIAVSVGENSDNPRLHGKALIGTPKYMSPDQFEGRNFDARSEIYSLGCLMYEVLSGRVPFEGENAFQILHKHAKNPPPTFAEVCPRLIISKALEEIVRRCLEKDPEDRFQSMDELRNVLSRLILKERRKSIGFDSVSKSQSGNQSNPAERLTEPDETDEDETFHAQTIRERGSRVAAVLTRVAAVVAVVGLVALICSYSLNRLEPNSSAIEEASNANASGDRERTASKKPPRPQVDEEDVARIQDPYAIEERKHMDAVIAFNREIEKKCTQDLASGKDTSEVYRLRCIARRNQGKQQLAMEDIEKAIKLDQHSAENHIARAALHFDSFNGAETVNDANLALTLQPKNYQYWLIRANPSADAAPDRNALKMAFSIDPKSSQCYAARALCSFLEKKNSEGQADLHKALELEDADAGAGLAGGQKEKMRGASSDTTDGADAVAMTDYYLGRCMMEAKDFERALFFFNRAAQRAPLFWPIYWYRSMIHILYIPDSVKALDDLNKAIAVNSSSYPLYLARVNRLKALDKLELALEDANRAVQLSRDNYNIREVRSEIYNAMGRKAEALADLDYAISHGTDHELVFRSKGKILADMNCLDEAEKALSRAIQINGISDYAYLARAKVYAKQGKYEKAVTDFSSVLKLRPNDPRVLTERAMAYEKLGKMDLARKDRMLVEKDPTLQAVNASQKAFSALSDAKRYLEKSEGIDQAKRDVINANAINAKKKGKN